MKKSTIAAIVILTILTITGGGYYYVKYVKQTDKHAGHTDEKQLYTCPMHPQIISEKPGSCPICGMDLVPVKKGEKQAETADAGEPSGLAAIFVPARTAEMLGLTFETVKAKELVKEVRTSAVIAADETRQYKVTTKIGGWVEKLYINQTGQYVKKGEPLLTVYSPDLLSAQQEYLSALKAEEKLANSNLKDTLKSLKESAYERLRLLDVSDNDIHRLEKTGKPERAVTLYAPATGYVMEKMVTAGQRIMMNDSLMTISDLSRVWAEADIYQPDLPFVKVGTPVKLTLSYWPGKIFHGRIAFLYPFVNPETRTLKARMEISNPELTLKPQMYADAAISYNIGRKLTATETAVFRTGTKEYVFIKDKDGHIKPVIVQTGFRSSDGYYEIISGLKSGDMAVSSANFLIDSESSLKAALQAVTGGTAGGSDDGAKGATTPPATGHEGHTR